MSAPSPPSISIAEKQTKHISLKDWEGNVNCLADLSNGRRQDANLLRNEASQTRNESEILSSWSRYYTNTKLSDRIAEEQQWIQTLKSVRRVLDDEITMLMDEKATAEREIEAYYRALSVVSDCLLTRDRRQIEDLTNDELHRQLKQELGLLEASKEQLTNLCTEGWDRLVSMNDISTKLKNDIAGKEDALEVDTNVLRLEKESAHNSYKPDVLRIPNEIVDHEVWLQEAQCRQTESEDQIRLGSKLRETLKLTRERAKMDYLMQVEATNYNIRKRLHDDTILKNELMWQRKNTIEEMERLSDEIARLHQTREEHESLLKCAETRQESRNMRPAMEKARDVAHTSLHEEIAHLRRIIQDIIDKTNKAICTYNELESIKVRLDHEIAVKEDTIQLEMRVLDHRRNLVEHCPAANMDKDVVLVKMEKQLAPSNFSQFETIGN